jgi:hypothetical protein
MLPLLLALVPLVAAQDRDTDPAGAGELARRALAEKLG